MPCAAFSTSRARPYPAGDNRRPGTEALLQCESYPARIEHRGMERCPIGIGGGNIVLCHGHPSKGAKEMQSHGSVERLSL